MAMDGAVVLALHSDTLFMEPLIAQARPPAAVVKCKPRHGMLRTRLADKGVDGPMRLLAATVCNFISALARRWLHLAASVHAAWDRCVAVTLLVYGCSSSYGQSPCCGLQKLRECIFPPTAGPDSPADMPLPMIGGAVRTVGTPQKNRDACVCRAAARLARRTWWSRPWTAR